MVLKVKFLALYKNFIVSRYRKVNQLIRLYTDYSESIKEEAKSKIDVKIANYKSALYNDYQRVYFDVASEEEIFTVVYNHKYEEYKKSYRMQYRVVRENLRREILKLNKQNAKLRAQISKLNEQSTPENEQKIKSFEAIIVENNSKIESITKQIPEEEAKYAQYVEDAANALKEEFEIQKQKGLQKNTGIDIEEYKASIEEKIRVYSEEITDKINASTDRKCKNIAAKLERLSLKSTNLKKKVNEAVEKYVSCDDAINANSSENKIKSLNKEIAVYECKLLEAKDDVSKEKYTKILNSLKGDLSLLNVQAKAKHELIKDDEILAVDDLCMYFGGIKAVNHLSFTVKHKEIFGLIGPNGAGKTTVFNCITQFYKPTAGNIVFRNKNNEIVDLTKEKVHNVILQGVVRTFQNLEVIKDITVLDNLLIAAHRDYTSGLFRHMLHTKILKVEEKVIKARANKILKFMGILKYRDMFAWGLPYGVLKKIEIARTLMCNPQLIILDEPAAGLNDSETVELAELIHRIRDEYDATILLVEHDMGLVMDVCDRICAISFGNLLALGTPSEIQSNKAVQEAYLGVSED
jgi:branched-chain amino acid transport system ATP-binding protein